MLPLFVIVPSRFVTLFRALVYVLTELKVNAPWLPQSSVDENPFATPTLPPLTVVSLPPWIVAPFTSCTAEVVPSTLIVPPLLLMVELDNAKMPPLLASSVPPVLDRPPPGLIVSPPPVTLASINPPAPFTTVKPPFPITPAPWMVLALVRVKVPPLCWMNAAPEPGAVDSVTVPGPWSVTLLPIFRRVLVAAPPFT